jgi:hypothetical protein
VSKVSARSFDVIQACILRKRVQSRTAVTAMIASAKDGDGITSRERAELLAAVGALLTSDNPEASYDDYKNRLGNLTLLEKPINIVAGNAISTCWVSRASR